MCKEYSEGITNKLTDLDKQLATSMTQELMETNLHLKGQTLPFDEQILR